MITLSSLPEQPSIPLEEPSSLPELLSIPLEEPSNLPEFSLFRWNGRSFS
jgi:hypothetical protein